jgi:hypothetical protein
VAAPIDLIIKSKEIVIALLLVDVVVFHNVVAENGVWGAILPLSFLAAMAAAVAVAML